MGQVGWEIFPNGSFLLQKTIERSTRHYPNQG